MLAETVKSNLKDISNLKMRSKTTKFSNLFSTNPTVSRKEEVSPFKQLLSREGLITTEDDDTLFDEIAIVPELATVEEISVEDDEIAEYIVENPNEVIVQFPLVSEINLEEKLPFFKSISMKLASI